MIFSLLLLTQQLSADNKHEQYIQNQLAHLQAASEGIKTLANSIPKPDPVFVMDTPVAAPVSAKAAPAPAEAPKVLEERPAVLSRANAVYPHHSTLKTGRVLVADVVVSGFSNYWIIGICVVAALVLGAFGYLAYQYSLWKPRSPQNRQSYRSLANKEAAEEPSDSPVNRLPVVASVTPASSPDDGGRKQSKYKSRKIAEDQPAAP